MSASSALLTASLLLPASVTIARVEDLRCEYLRQPIGVESPAPRLSWTSRIGSKNWKQSAYRILVASSPYLLARDQPDLWDSGRIRSNSSIQIPYGGKSLVSRQACFWKVKVWDQAGRTTAWSKPEEWDMGLIDPNAWRGSEWIGRSTAELPAPFMRKEFSCSGKVRRARLYASGIGYAELHLNGKKLGGASERDPGYTNFNKRVLYVAQDVTAAIKNGRNSVGAILGTGWYDVHDLATWNFDRAPWRGRPRLRLVLYIEFADGHTQQISSDRTWKTADGPLRFDGIYTGEVYDARKEMPGWDLPGFNDHAWVAVAPMEAPSGTLAARPCPGVAITETIKAKRILEPRPEVYVIDFGQNIAGHVQIKVSGSAGRKIQMRYSERIRDDGSIERSQLDVYMTKTNPSQPFQTDTYICKGTGLETWEQRFSYSGFRYVEITGFPGKPSLDSFHARLANTDLESAGSFSCSSELLNRIQRATRYSYLSNAQSIPTDCPQREKNGWTGDAHLAAEAGLMNFRSASFYTKWLDDLSDDQSPDGNLSLIVPSGGWGRGATHPAWNSAYLIIADDLFKYCGDSKVFADHYEHLRRYVEFLYAQTKDDIVTFDSLGDWLPWSTETPSQLTSTIFLYADLKIVSSAAMRLGNSADASKYQVIAEKVKASFNNHFFRQEDISSSTQAALSMAIYFHLVEAGKKQDAFDALVRNVIRQGHIDTGILGAKYLLRVLSEGGRSDLAYKLVARREQPGWGWWIEQGATTLWEDWKGESSLNHIMFGDVSNWFFQWIAGIGLDENIPAFHHIVIRPQPVGDLTWARGEEESPYGKIISSWRRNGDRFHLDIEIPANASANVLLPGMPNSVAHLEFKRSGSGGYEAEVGSGTYSFECLLSK